MSTKPDTRYAAKRRAAARKRTREIGRYIFAYFIVALLVLGTISTVFIAQVGTPTTPVVTATSTPANAGFGQLVTQGDSALAGGDFASAIGFYEAYISQNPNDASVSFKLGKAYVDTANPAPNYPLGVSYLQQALNSNPAGSFAAEAQALITQYSAAANATSAVLASAVPVTGTATLTNSTSVVPTGTSVGRTTPTAPITATTTTP